MPQNSWPIITLSRLFGFYALVLGAAFWFGGPSALSNETYAVFRQIGEAGPFPVHYEVGFALFVTSGLILLRQTRVVGLAVAVGVFFLITLAFTTAMVRYDRASWTAPVAYAFATILAAWLHSMNRAFR